MREHLLAGVGRGAFESAFQRFQPGGLGATLTHPENLVFQWVSELGLPVGLLLLVGCAAALLRALGRPQPQIEQVACLAAVAGVALHDLVDFGMEFAGVAVPTSIALALGVAGGASVRRTSRRVAVLATGGLAVVTALALLAGRADLTSEGAALAKLDAGGAAAVAEEAARIARRHPADYLPQLVAARAFAAERPLRADKLFGFANRAMYLNPAHPLPHRLAAQALLAIRKRSQAQLEYRLSWDGEPALVQELARSFQTPADLLAALPDSENAVLMMMSTLEGLGRAVDAQQVGELSVARIGEREAVLSRLANLALARRDAAAADLLGERMTSVAKDRPAGVLARASARVVRGDLDDAIRLLETEGLTSYGRFPDVLLRLAELRLQKKDAKGTREALRRLSPGLDRGMRVRSLSLEAASYEQDGLSTKAAASIKTAMLVQPEDPSLRLRHAQLLEQTGRLDEALSEIEPLAANPSLKQQIGAMKDRIVARRKERSELEHWKDASPTEPAPR